MTSAPDDESRRVKRLILGERLASHKLDDQLLPKHLALPIFASDPLSSVAYAPQELLLILLLGGLSFLTFAPGVAAVVVLLLVVGSEVVTVYTPVYVVGHWWEQILHNHKARRIRQKLMLVHGVTLALVPWLLDSSQLIYGRRSRPIPGQERRGEPVRPRMPIRRHVSGGDVQDLPPLPETNPIEPVDRDLTRH